MLIGEAIYYREMPGQFIQHGCYQGKTSRSWLVGSNWHQRKLPKKTTILMTEHDYKEQQWSGNHIRNILEAVRRCTPEQLRQIAAIIGYEEKKS